LPIDTGSAKYHLTVLEAPPLFRRKRHVTWPFALEITAGDFAFATGHCRIERATIEKAAAEFKVPASGEAMTRRKGEMQACRFPLWARLRHSSPSDGIRPPVLCVGICEAGAGV
jgi:hypothetical protein